MSDEFDGQGQAFARRSEIAARTALRLTEAAAEMSWRGPDPFDGLWFGWPRPLVAGKRRRQAIMQAHVRSPVDFRPLYRRRHPLIPKALGIFGSAAVRLWRLTGDERFRVLALDAIDTLDADRSAGEEAWGYWWDMQTRWSFYAAGSPNVVVTAFAAHGLQDAAEAFGVRHYSERAQVAAQWVRDALWLPDGEYFVYHPGSTVLIHNANVLAAALVHRLEPGDPRPQQAIPATMSAQATDGSWPYGAGAENRGFVDSFHSGYVLGCLAPFAADEEIHCALERGADYYTSRFFDSAGRAMLWPDRREPEDAHSAGTALTTLTILCRLGLADRSLLRRVLDRVVSHVVRGDHAVHRRGRWLRSSVHYLRWCDAHVALGLSAAAEFLTGHGSDSDR
jgi:hypothetical protein